MMSVGRTLAGLAAITLAASACSSSATPLAPTLAPPTAAASSAPTVAPPTATAAPTPSPSPTPIVVTLNANVYWAGFAITVGTATYDQTTGKLTIDAMFKNTGTGDADPARFNGSMLLSTGGQFIIGSTGSTPIPPTATSRDTMEFGVPQGFTMDSAILTFGKPDEHQATVALVAGGAVQTEQPADLALSGAIKVGRYLKYVVERGRLVPASCTGTADKLTFGPAKKSEASLIVWGKLTLSGSKYDEGVDQAFVKLPDGTTASATGGGNIYIQPNSTLRDQGMCFPVQIPASGKYVLTLHADRASTTGSLTLSVP